MLFGAPVDEVAGVECDAEEIGGDEAELGGADADDADDGAVNGSNYPSLPQFLSDKHGGQDGQNARQIIKPDGVEHIQHIGSKRQREP